MPGRTSLKVGPVLLGLLLLRLDGGLVETGHAETARPVVTTQLGAVAGVLAPNGVRMFRGIPFAAPPVGALRWAAPQPAAPWRDVRDATNFGASCPAPAGLAPGSGSPPRSVHGPDYDIWFAKAEKDTSEDCLTLNVWAPSPAPHNAPVVVLF